MFADGLGSSLVDGVAPAMGMPECGQHLGRDGAGQRMPATANPVAIGGWACTTARVVPLRDLQVHQHSDDGSRSPCSFRPSRSGAHIMSGVMNPLHAFRRHRRRSRPSRVLILPSLEAVYPRAYMRRPT
jgi:hypothetical protein